MKYICSPLYVIGLAAIVCGGAFTSEGSASTNKLEILWEAPTNDWPQKLWNYKVIPQNFSDAVVSNLLEMASFTDKDQIKAPNYIDSKDEVIFYGNLDGKMKHLAICPTLGFIEYHDGKAKSPSQLQPIVGVPAQDQATRLGLKYLRKMGIDKSELSTKTENCELNLHWERQTIEFTDQTTQAERTLTNAYGVFFLRRIDGIDEVGIGLNGGAYMSFGNDARPIDFQISWRNLKPYQLNDCPSPQQVNEMILSGQITFHVFGSKVVYSAPIQRLIITKATPLYNGKHYDEPMDFVSPFVRFEAVAQDGTNRTSLWFESAMTTRK